MKKLFVTIALILSSACANITEPTISGTKSNKDVLSGYLVATGLNGTLMCKVGDVEYANYSAAPGAGEGDSCTVGEM